MARGKDNEDEDEDEEVAPLHDERHSSGFVCLVALIVSFLFLIPAGATPFSLSYWSCLVVYDQSFLHSYFCWRSS